MLTANCLRQSILFTCFQPKTILWGGLALTCLLPGVPARGHDAAQKLFKEAQVAKARGDLAEAEAKYLELIRQSPEMANAYHNLGIVYLSEHKYRDAVQALEKAVKLAPSEPGGWSFRASLIMSCMSRATPWRHFDPLCG